MQDIDPLELRRALGSFMTGVTVITTIDGDGAPRGFTANSFTSVSLDEPLVLFCLANKSINRETYLSAGKFAINILSEDQRETSNTFASPKTVDRFAQVDWRSEETGSPILDGSAAWFDCVTHETVEAGDHVIMIGRVVAFDHIAANPLGYWKGNYVSALLEHQASEASHRASQVGAIIEHDERILLIEQDGVLDLPSGSHIGSTDKSKSLLGVLASYGVSAEIGFVFSVFEDGITGEAEGVMVYYRGTTEGLQTSSDKAKWYALNDIPWSQLPNKETCTMLHRYIDESVGGRYSVYVGDSQKGKVHTLK